MIDVSAKFDTLREAVAEARLAASAGTLRLVAEGKVPKGDVAAFAAAAGMLAAKRTPELIPHCHPVPLDHVDVAMRAEGDALVFTARVRAVWKTGVEMEALVAATAAALTAYDLLKFARDPALALAGTRLVEKSGGYSDWRERDHGLRAAVLVVSTSTAAGKRQDTSGRLLERRLREEGVEVAAYRVVADDPAGIAEAVTAFADRDGLDLVLATGGTGLSPEDVTVEALKPLAEREIPGIAEAMRAHGRRRTPFAMLSRSWAGVRGATLLLALPGSSRGAGESLDALLPGLFHVFPMLRRGGHETADRGQRGR